MICFAVFMVALAIYFLGMEVRNVGGDIERELRFLRAVMEFRNGSEEETE